MLYYLQQCAQWSHLTARIILLLSFNATRLTDFNLGYEATSSALMKSQYEKKTLKLCVACVAFTIKRKLIRL